MSTITRPVAFSARMKVPATWARARPSGHSGSSRDDVSGDVGELGSDDHAKASRSPTNGTWCAVSRTGQARARCANGSGFGGAGTTSALLVARAPGAAARAAATALL